METKVPPLEPFTALIMSPNVHLRSLVRSILRSIGGQTLEARDLFATHAELDLRHIHLLLVDLDAAGDALRVIKLVRSMPQANRCHMPIVALGAEVTGSTVKAAITAGADQFVAKPVSYAGLATRARAALTGMRGMIHNAPRARTA
jgi:DNA-binding response OmpR family regulator